MFFFADHTTSFVDDDITGCCCCLLFRSESPPVTMKGLENECPSKSAAVDVDVEGDLPGVISLNSESVTCWLRLSMEVGVLREGVVRPPPPPREGDSETFPVSSLRIAAGCSTKRR